MQVYDSDVKQTPIISQVQGEDCELSELSSSTNDGHDLPKEEYFRVCESVDPRACFAVHEVPL